MALASQEYPVQLLLRDQSKSRDANDEDKQLADYWQPVRPHARLPHNAFLHISVGLDNIYLDSSREYREKSGLPRKASALQ